LYQYIEGNKKNDEQIPIHAKMQSEVVALKRNTSVYKIMHEVLAKNYQVFKN